MSEPSEHQTPARDPRLEYVTFALGVAENEQFPGTFDLTAAYIQQFGVEGTSIEESFPATEELFIVSQWWGEMKGVLRAWAIDPNAEPPKPIAASLEIDLATKAGPPYYFGLQMRVEFPAPGMYAMVLTLDLEGEQTRLYQCPWPVSFLPNAPDTVPDDLLK